MAATLASKKAAARRTASGNSSTSSSRNKASRSGIGGTRFTVADGRVLFAANYEMIWNLTPQEARGMGESLIEYANRAQGKK